MLQKAFGAIWRFIMSHSQKTEVCRMRPYLGTFVKVGVSGLNLQDAIGAIDRAFVRIATVEAHMSAHNPNSDLGRLWRSVKNKAVTVHPWTFQVIAEASRFHRLSDGIFDITIGDVLEDHRLLPSWRADQRNFATGTMADIELLHTNTLRLRRPLRLDLGGIAKGFAVDLAVETLIEAGAASGCVNAGGDFRIFGDRLEPLLLRDPGNPCRLLRAGELQTGAVATSAGYFNRHRRDSRFVTPLVDGRCRTPLNLCDSITVLAASCMCADALTKVLAVDPDRGAALLDRFGAKAMLLTESQNDATCRILPP